MITRSGKQLQKKIKFRLKRITKSIFKNHVYVAKDEFIKGLKVTGDLGFLRKPVLTKEQRFYLSLNLSRQTVYDIGAHIGLMTLFFSRAVGQSGRVISFEPNPDTYNIITKNVTINALTNTRVENIGLGTKRETLTLVSGEHEGGLGTLNNDLKTALLNNKRGIKPQTHAVEVWPLDEYIAAQALPDPKFVKIDVEGFEYDVLLGMQDTLKRCKPVVVVEVHAVHSEDQHFLRENLKKTVKFLSSYGYDIKELFSGETIVESYVEPALNSRTLVCGLQDIPPLWNETT